MPLSETSARIISLVRENEAERTLSAVEAMAVCGHDGELRVVDMSPNQMLQYALWIATDVGKKFEARCRSLQADLEIQRVQMLGTRAQRRGKQP